MQYWKLLAQIDSTNLHMLRTIIFNAFVLRHKSYQNIAGNELHFNITLGVQRMHAGV